jgi:hypothetical protein
MRNAFGALPLAVIALHIPAPFHSDMPALNRGTKWKVIFGQRLSMQEIIGICHCCKWQGRMPAMASTWLLERHTVVFCE